MTPDSSKFLSRIPGVSAQTLGYGSLFSRLQKGHTLVTANSRLTRVLTDRYNQWCINNDQTHWQSPAICSWDQWINRLWDTAALTGVVTTTRAIPGHRQLINLWENILKIKPLSADLVRPESLASQLRDTRRLLSGWKVDMTHPAWFGDDNENHTAFRKWNHAFDRLCEKTGWMNPDDRLAVLAEAAGDMAADASGFHDFIGFDEFSPAGEDLLKAMAASGESLCLLTITPRQGQASLWKSKDSRDELNRMARWVRSQATKDPDASIAIVVPDLQERRQELERTLGEILTPGVYFASNRAKPWNISIGVPLIRVPMIETAFNLLHLLGQQIDIQTVGQVLRSPWLDGGETERNSRAFLEKCLRENYPRQLKLDELIYRANEVEKYDRYNQPIPVDQQQPQPWNSPQLLNSLKKLRTFSKNHTQNLPPSSWAELFDQLLIKVGWMSGEDDTNANLKEDSENWQAMQKWRECLRQLASLDATTTKLGRTAAIGQLRQICREHIFQPHTPPARIQVLGLYEASGLRFDHLWVLGLHNDNWPGSAKPNPFIPGRLQREANLPNSSPERELEVARTITQRLLNTADHCIFSYPGQVDGENMLPSPLLIRDDIVKTETVEHWQKSDWCKTVADSPSPQIDHLEMPGPLVHKTARGGSSILKHQALCPFRAFVSNRLGADGMETPVDGISPALHGSLVHEVLENFWKETKTLSALRALDEPALKARLRQHVDSVTDEQRGLAQRPAFKRVEAERVFRHVMNYLALEKQRDDFEVIGFEEEIMADIEGQKIRLIIDRIDRLPSGEEIIIDYKTGTVNPKKWFGERPEDPQLPLYATNAGKTPAAVAFGIIREDGCEFKGLVSDEGLLPGLPPKETVYTRDQIEAGRNMPETIRTWRQTLQQLMSGFIQGHAEIDPKAESTCQNTYCELQAVCRISELRQRQSARRHEDTRQPGESS